MKISLFCLRLKAAYLSFLENLLGVFTYIFLGLSVKKLDMSGLTVTFFFLGLEYFGITFLFQFSLSDGRILVVNDSLGLS